jgi:two-component system LytT family response regulator
MKALIVDGDPYTRVRLGVFLREVRGIEIVGECEGGFQAVEACAVMRPDLMIVGRAPADLEPIEVLVAVADLPPVRALLVFDRDTEVAVAAVAEGFSVLASDFDRIAFRRALDNLVATEPPAPAALERRLRAVFERIGRGRPPARRLVVRSQRRVEFVRATEIDWIGAARNYVKLHVGDTTHLLRSTMASLEKRLDPRAFLRIHRSIIVNVERMREIQPWFHGEAVVILEDGARLNLSRGYRPRVERYLARVAAGIA